MKVNKLIVFWLTRNNVVFSTTGFIRFLGTNLDDRVIIVGGFPVD